MNIYANPYQNQELRFPKHYQEDVLRYTQTKSDDGRSSKPSKSPFPRMVDLWLLAVCFGAKKKKADNIPREKTYKFIEGTIFTSDQWRVDLLSLLAIGYTGNTDILKKPAEVIHLANNLAAAGLPDVFDMLHDGHSDPIYNISDKLTELLQSR